MLWDCSFIKVTSLCMLSYGWDAGVSVVCLL